MIFITLSSECRRREGGSVWVGLGLSSSDDSASPVGGTSQG